MQGRALPGNSRPSRARLLAPVCALVMLLAPPATARGQAADRAKLLVREEGLYELTGAQLREAGLDVGEWLSTRLAISSQGRPVALRIVGPAGDRVTDGTRIRFWAQGIDSKYTRTNVYWVLHDGAVATRMETGRELAAAAGPVADCFPETLHIEADLTYAYLIFAPDKADADHWLWHKIRAKGRAEVSFDAPGLAAGRDECAVRVELRGSTSTRSNPDHHTIVEVNGHVVEDALWDGAGLHYAEAPLPPGVLKPTGNTLSVFAPGDSAAGDVDSIYLSALEVAYPRALAALDGQLIFGLAPADGSRTAAVSALPGDTDVYDVTSPERPVFLGRHTPVDGSVHITVAGAGERRFAAVSDDAVRRVEVVATKPTDLRTDRSGADYIVVTDAPLAPALEPLLAHRRGQGLRVRVALIDDAYDAFSHGIQTPAAIRDLTRHAIARWEKPAPRFLFLVGDATYDYRDDLGTGVRNIVPSQLVPVGSNIETPNDDWFGCTLDGAHGPAVCVGRLPARTPDDVEVYVRKVLAYEVGDAEEAWWSRAVLVADHDLPTDTQTDYEAVAARTAERLTGAGCDVSQFAVRSALFADPPVEVREALTPRVVGAINKGCAILGFRGHGDEGYWSRARVLTLDDAMSLTNGDRLPIAIEVSCFTGAFDYPTTTHPSSMGEALLLNPAGGAIACVSAARLGGTSIDVPFIDALIDSPELRVGEAFRAAKASMGLDEGPLWELHATYNLLGDPALRIPRPADE